VYSNLCIGAEGWAPLHPGGSAMPNLGIMKTQGILTHKHSGGFMCSSHICDKHGNVVL